MDNENAMTKTLSQSVIEQLAKTKSGLPVTGAGIAELDTPGKALESAIDARTGYQKPVVNLSFDQGGLNEWKSMSLVNGNAAPDTTQVILGSLIGVAGGAAQWGQPANASDDAAVTTDGVASVGFAQALSALSSSKPLIITDLMLDGAEDVINAITIQYNALHFDNTVKPEVIPQAVGEFRTDFNRTVWHVPGPFPIDELHFIQLSLASDANYIVRIRIEYWEGASQMVQV